MADAERGCWEQGAVLDLSHAREELAVRLNAAATAREGAFVYAAPNIAESVIMPQSAVTMVSALSFIVPTAMDGEGWLAVGYGFGSFEMYSCSQLARAYSSPYCTSAHRVRSPSGSTPPNRGAHSFGGPARCSG